MQNVNLEYYKIFYYVVQTGSFTAAAERLCISQPAISQAMKMLESNVGVPLLIRTAKGVKLSPEGDLLYSYIERGYEFILSGEKALQKMLDFENGEICIGASDMTLQFYLLPYLEKFHQQYPNIKITVTNGPTPETIKHLYHGRIDFGIVSGPFESKKEIEVYPVKEIEDIFVAGKRFSHLRDRKVTYEELERLPIICLEHNTSTRQYVDQFLMQQRVQLQPEFELATSNMIVQFAIRNLGVGCVVDEFAMESMKEGKLFPLQFQDPMPKRHIAIITSEKNGISTIAKKMLELLLRKQV